MSFSECDRTVPFRSVSPVVHRIVVAFALLVVDLFVPQQRRAITHYLAVAILAVTVWLALAVQGDQAVAFGGMYVRDLVGDVLKAVVCVVSALALLYAKPYLDDRGLFKGEFHLLVLFSVLGMLLLVAVVALSWFAPQLGIIENVVLPPVEWLRSHFIDLAVLIAGR